MTNGVERCRECEAVGQTENAWPAQPTGGNPSCYAKHNCFTNINRSFVFSVRFIFQYTMECRTACSGVRAPRTIELISPVSLL